MYLCNFLDPHPNANLGARWGGGGGGAAVNNGYGKEGQGAEDTL